MATQSRAELGIQKLFAKCRVDKAVDEKVGRRVDGHQQQGETAKLNSSFR